MVLPIVSRVGVLAPSFVVDVTRPKRYSVNRVVPVMPVTEFLFNSIESLGVTTSIEVRCGCDCLVLILSVDGLSLVQAV